MSWFKDHFIKCHDRAALVKTWLPAQYTGPPTFLDQLVYDRALLLVSGLQRGTLYSLMTGKQQSRTAARKELLDQATAPDECEKLYEESLWCLYALRDDLLQADNPFLDEDRSTISTCVWPSFAFWSGTVSLTLSILGIKRTKLRLVRCRVRMGMTDRERLKDARRDDNLTDVQRIPAPWDLADPESEAPRQEPDPQSPQRI